MKKEDKEKEETHIAIFKGKAIRRKFIENKWFFSVVDIISVLTESDNPRNYWSMLKIREKESSEIELSTNCVQLKLKSGDGKEYETDCADTEGIFRIIQSIPSKKAEPFKRWLARVGYERMQEIENPELAQERMKKLYELKGYSKDWVDKRLRGIAVRQDLTEEWKKRGVEEDIEFAILTNEISKAAFGKTVEEYKRFKKISKENLRDHMTELELIFSMLGEASTAEIERAQNPKEFDAHLEVSKKGGTIAKNARLELESETGEEVVISENYLTQTEKEAKEKRKKKKLIEVENFN
ncbi:MAG: Bro-N domain-containing protein [Nanoarchaeota archaeon]|nr:Bro-N domain-containing protein [Nanoarchaeota archaeon]